MSLLESLNATGGVGTIKTMVNPSGGNHPAFDWAKNTADEIFNPVVDEANANDVVSVRSMITSVLEPVFDYAIQRERLTLKNVEDHCSKQIDAHLDAELALKNIYKLPEHIWTNKLTNSDWYHAALCYIGTMIATAKHIERLLFADANPNNTSAQNYKLGDK